jgi:AcrR family transcriptional regulator
VTKSPRTRLDPQERRAQLVELGLQMLSSRPLDKVAIDDIAAEAGISRGLLFHYFPTKRDYHIAVAQAAAQEMLDRTDPPAELPPAERLRTAVAAFVDHVTENRDAYVAFIRGSAGGDPELIEIYERTRAAFTDRVIGGLGELGMPLPPPARLRAVARGWVALAEEITVDWLSVADADLERDEVVSLIDDALVALVTMALGAWPFGEH